MATEEAEAMPTKVSSSNQLLAKLETIKWLYGIRINLHGKDTLMLVKYVIEENAYGLMLTDFSSTYFECLMGEQIEAHYSRFNRSNGHRSYQQILVFLADLLKDIRKTSVLTFEKLAVECCTQRITIKASKMFMSFKFNWNFYVIATDPQVFMTHCSLPMLRGLLHYHKIAKKEEEAKEATTSEVIVVVDEYIAANHHNGDDDNLVNNSQLFMALDDSLLSELFL